MRSLRWRGFAALFLLSSALLACMDQYNPRPTWALYKEEQTIASKVHPKLTETGEIPAAGAGTVSIDEKYTQLCASCHGAQGNGDGPAGAALNPHPRNFHDKAWQAKVDDAHIHTVIKGGGGSAGLSPTMPPWGGVLNDTEIDAMVKKIRGFGG